MTDTDEDCHILEWAELMDVSVPEAACEDRQHSFRPREPAR